MSVEGLVEQAAAKGYGAAGLCDRDGLYAAVRFYNLAKRANLKPILGVELTSPEGVRPGSGRLFAFALDFEGYSRLCGLITRRQLEPGRFDRAGEAAAATAGGHVALAASGRKLLYRLKKAGAQKGRLYARLTGRDREGDGEACAVAEWLGLPVLAAPTAAFCDPGGYVIHRILRAAKHRPPESAPGDYLLSPEQMKARFASRPGALEAAADLAAACNVELPLGNWQLPAPPLPPGETAGSRLSALSYAGLARRVNNVTTAYLRRLENEIDVISRMGFAGYFLVVEDIARFARREGIPNIGRGSGASSLVSYCLGLTHVDPVKEGLYFERFLNPERRNPPDIDLDFSWRERDLVIRHVYDTYGEANVCMIATHNCFSMRSAFREVGKAMGVPEEELGLVAKAVPHTAAKDFALALKCSPAGRGAPLRDHPWRDILRAASWVDGFPRHLSVHCGGVVVSPQPLTRRLSLQRSARGLAVTQADMFDVEAMGLVKIDLLGNRSLGVLIDAVDAVKRHTGAVPSVFPPERAYGDAPTNAILQQGKTMGCFYIESPGMRLLLQRLKTRTFRDLTAVSSIIRPGVSESGMMDAYVARRLGEEPPVYAHPALEPILRDTFGVMVYQEDVIRVAHEFAGLSLGEADLLRRAMSGKYRSRDEMAGLERAFFERGGERGIAPAVMEELWRQIRSFAGYAFCKAHSASFAQLSYQVAYLKAHHPAEFFAALINNQGGFYGTPAYVEEARRWGLAVLSPDVNASEEDFAGKDRRLRCGFLTLRGVRRAVLDRLYEERGERPFSSLADLWSRLRAHVAPADLEILIRAGACDGFGLHRGMMLYLLQSFGGDVKAMARAEDRVRWDPVLRPAPNAEDGIELYVPCGPPPGAPGPARMAAAWGREAKRSDDPGRPLSLAEVLAGERRTLGYCVTAHPLAPLLGWAEARGYVHAKDLSGCAGRRVRVWGQVITNKRIVTRRHREGMAFATLEDPTGLSELVLFPDAFRRFGQLLTRGKPLVVEGKAENNRGGLTVTADRAWAIRGVVVHRGLQGLRRDGEGARRAV
ncbi:MAG: DNA polymerase III subunit alpha [Acidobacteriota bacterium]